MQRSLNHVTHIDICPPSAKFFYHFGMASLSSEVQKRFSLRCCMQPMVKQVFLQQTPCQGSLIQPLITNIHISGIKLQQQQFCIRDSN